MREVVLSIKDLRISFKTNSGLVKALRGISFDLYKNETLAIVGESGSGKSVTSKAILGVLENNKIIEQGQIIYEGEDLLRIKEKTYNRLRGSDIAIIYQDTMSTLNPIMKVGQQVLESLIKKQKKTKKENISFVKSLPYFDKQRQKDLMSLTSEQYIEKYQDDVERFNDYQKTISDSYAALNKEISNYLKKHFVDEQSFNVSNAEREFKNIYRCYKDLKTIKGDALDCFVSSALSLVKSLFISLIKSFNKVEKRKKLFAKYPDSNSDYYLLPSKVKANQPEEIIEPLYFYNRVKEELHQLSVKISQEKNELVSLKQYQLLLDIIKEKLTFINTNIDKVALKNKVLTLLNEVGIKDASLVYQQYPFELSGGMRQRIAIIIAIAMEPKILICDEPTTSLDVTVQKQILNLIEEVKRKRKLSVIFITHDLGVVSKIADRVVVMYAGKILEKGSVYDIFYDPRHPYTWSLLSAIPENSVDENFITIKGNVPNMIIPLKGDAFAYRSDYALKQDAISFPEEYVISDTHVVYSHLYHPFAKEVTPPLTVVVRIRESLRDNPINIPTYKNKKNSVLEILKKEGTI